jgi:tripartite-type tricarboxylate transporter receptor subunit TctC
VAHAKANPGKVNVGTPGNGTLGHLSLLLVESHAGVQLMNVPYKGTAPLTNDLLGGQIDVAMDFMTTYVPLVQADKLRALAVTSATRANQLPGTATAQESGMKDFEATAWYALVAPAGTPTEITDKINKATNDYIASAEGKDLMVKLGMQPAGGKPADLKAFVSAELAKWGPIVKAANISF